MNSSVDVWRIIFLAILFSTSSFAHNQCDCECNEKNKQNIEMSADDPFQSMHQNIQKRMIEMDQLFNDMAFGSFGSFGNPSGFFKLNRTGIQTKKYDLDKYKVVEIFSQNKKSSDLNVDVKGDKITISVNKTKEETSENDSGFFSQSSFQSVSKKIIPIPKGVISEQVKIENKGGKVILKFPKKRV